MYIPSGLTVLNQSSPAFDVFGRLKVAMPTTLFDSKLLHDKLPLFWDEATVSGSGFTSTYLENEAAVEITTDGTTGKFVRQTFQRFNYQPGKAQEVAMTGVLSAETNGTFGTVQRSSASGSVVDTVIEGIKNLNGSRNPNGWGTSTLESDHSKTQIYTFEMEWLGVGITRHGLVRSGQPYIFHYFDNDNINDAVYMSTPNLPLRYEIEVTETETIKRIGFFDDNNGLFVQYRHPKGAGSMKCICGTVISSGGQEENGVVRSASTGATQLDANSAGTLYALIGMRLKTTHIDAIVKQISFSLLSASQASYEFSLLLNPTVDGTFTYADQTNSAVQTALGATANTVTGGTLILAGFGAGQSSILEEIKNTLYLGSSGAGVPNTLVLCIRPLAANLDIYGSITWREL